MKKRITFVLAMLLALVMSFALIACGEPEGQKPTPPDKTVVMAKALTSLGEYLDANVQKGKLDYSADTAGTDKTGGSVEFTRNGTDIYYKLGTDAAGTERLLDARTGLSYIKKNNKWSFDGTAYPQGLVEYGMDVIAGLVEDDGVQTQTATSDEKFSLDDIEYNAKTNSLSVRVDVADRVNRPLGPIQEAYDGGSVKSIIDLYLAEYYGEITTKLPIIKLIGKPLTVNNIATYLKLELVRVKDQSFVDYVGNMTNTNIRAAYEEYLVARGLEGDRLEAAKARKVGEAVEGVLAYINAKIDIDEIKDGDYSGITDIVKTIANGTDQDRAELFDEFMDYVAINAVDTKNYEKDVSNLIETVTSLLGSIKIKPLIDGITELNIPGMSEETARLLGVATPVVKEIIAEQVTLEKLGATVELKLKADYTVDTIAVELIASHDYDGDSDLPFLSDNDYKATVELKLTGHSNELEASHELDFAPYDKDTNNKLHDRAVSVMQLFDEDSVSVYIETRMFDEVEAGDVSVAYVDGNGERHEFDAENAVEFIGSAFLFRADGILAAASAEIANGIGVNYVDMQATVSYGDAEADSYEVNIRLYIVTDASTDSAADLITRIAESLK